MLLVPNGNWLVFELFPGIYNTVGDLYVLEIATGNLLQVTNTPSVSEQSPDW